MLNGILCYFVFMAVHMFCDNFHISNPWRVPFDWKPVDCSITKRAVCIENWANIAYLADLVLGSVSSLTVAVFGEHGFAVIRKERILTYCCRILRNGDSLVYHIHRQLCTDVDRKIDYMDIDWMLMRRIYLMRGSAPLLVEPRLDVPIDILEK